MAWDPATYQQFSAERSRPFTDLLGRVRAHLREEHEVRRVVDLGCGTGRLTAVLAATWPRAEVTGVDSSAEMLAGTGELAGQAAGRLRFELGDLRRWRTATPVDVLVSNATLQWVAGHAGRLPRWVQALRPGGVIGLQVPAGAGTPSHVLLRETVASGPWASRLAPLLGDGPTDEHAVRTPAEYAEILFSAGCELVDAWETTYLHVLDPDGRDGNDAVLAWVSGTVLRPFLAALRDDERGAFVDAYAARLRAAYPRRPYGTPFPFRRYFAVARRR